MQNTLTDFIGLEEGGAADDACGEQKEIEMRTKTLDFGGHLAVCN